MTTAELKCHELYGRLFVVVAEFDESDVGIREANLYMERHQSVGVLAVKDGRVILVSNDDNGASPNVDRLVDRIKAAARADRWGRHGEVVSDQFIMAEAQRNGSFTWRLGDARVNLGQVRTVLQTMAIRGLIPAESLA